MEGQGYDTRVAGRLPLASRRGRAAGLAALAVAGAGGAVALLRWRLWSGGVPAPEPAALRDWFDPAELVRSRDYRRGVWAMAAASVLVAPAVGVAAALTGSRWRPVVVRLAAGRTWRAGLATGAGLAVALSVAALPLAAARYAWGRHYGLVTQGVGGWLADAAKGIGIQTVLLGAVGTGLAVMIRRWPRAWWVGLSGLTVALVYGLTLLAPIVVEPLFQKTTPLRDEALSRDILDIARKVGVDAKDVKVSDASRRTTVANAYVSGFGSSRHIVLYDTLLRDFPRDQVRVVVAHELVHAEQHHVLKGATWGAILAIPACLMMFAVVGWRTGFEPAGPGEAGTDLVVRRLAVAAATAIVLSAASAPLGNWVSRAMERQADWGALQATRDPAADIGLQQGLTRTALGVPDPPGWVMFLFGTHPTALERIGLALRAQKG